MMKFLSILSSIVLISSLVAAEELQSPWDASMDAAYRSYPSGAALGVQGGWSKMFWGQAQDEYRYGYFRLGGRLQSSGIVNKGEAKISLFPISFWGIEFTYGASHRNLKKMTTLDCSLIYCKGSVQRSKLTSPLYLGFGPVFARLRGEWLWLKSSQSNNKLSADESLTIPFQSEGDQILMGDLLLGYKFNEAYKMMGLFEKAQTQQTKVTRQFAGILGEISLNPSLSHKIYAGLGIYNTSFTPQHGQVFIIYSYTFAKGIGF